jgi:hypothetical protein
VNILDLDFKTDWPEEQARDRELALVRLMVKTGSQAEFEDLEDKEFWIRNKEFLSIANETLFLKNKSGEQVIVVPSHMRDFICSVYHDSATAGHLGFEKTYKSISARFYWPRMKSQVFDFCKTCHTCQAHKPRLTTQGKWPMISIRVEKPWDMFCTDIAGPLKETARGNKYIIIAIDHFSKFCVAQATSRTTAEITIDFIRDEIVSKFGAPGSLLSDQGRNYESKALDEFCKANHIKKVRTTSYHPQANGLAERTIKTLKSMLSTVVNANHDDWDLKLGQVVFNYNNTVHNTDPKQNQY